MRGEEIAQPVLRSAPGPMPAVAWWSVERVLYGVAVMIGLWLRVYELGYEPLSPWEASNSWPAWLVANGLSVADTPTPTSALFYSLQWLLFWSGVNNDAGARFVSAVAGTLLIVLPWWWRGFLGRRVSLLVAFLFAIDSWLLGFSRLADGASVAMAVGLLLIIGMSQVVRFPDSLTWKRIVAVCCGLLLVSGPMGWNFVPMVLWWGWLLRDELAAAGAFDRKTLLLVLFSALVGATLLFARLDALAWVASGTSVWLTQFDGRSAGPLLPLITGGYDLSWPWLRLVADASPLLPLGMAGLAVLVLRAVRAGGRNDTSRLLLHLMIGWLLWGLILWLLPGRSPLALPVLGVPLLILCAFAIDGLLRTLPQQVDWREAGAVVLTLIILIISGGLWLAALMSTRTYDPVLAQAALVIFGLAIAIVIAFGVWANRRDAAWLAAVLFSALLLVFYLRSSWRLSFANVLAEPAGWLATVAHPEVRLLAGDMETLSSHRSGDPYQLPVQVQVAPAMMPDERVVPARPDPVVGWELRNMRNLTWVSAPQVAEDADPLPLVVTPMTTDVESQQLDLPSSYAGSRYHVDTWWLPNTLVEENIETVEGEASVARLWTRALQPWWRWFVYREPTRAPENRDVILWAPVENPLR